MLDLMRDIILATDLAHHLRIFKAPLSFANFLNRHCNVRPLAVPGQNALLML